MFINLNKDNRHRLTSDQQLFLLKTIPLSKQLYYWTRAKAELKGLNSSGIATSIVLGLIIYRSKWGTHPLSQEKHNGKKANNLVLLTMHPTWPGKTIEFEDVKYRSFKDITEFAINWSDDVCFYGLHNEALLEKIYEEQLRKMCTSLEEYVNIATIINTFNLREFDSE